MKSWLRLALMSRTRSSRKEFKLRKISDESYAKSLGDQLDCGLKTRYLDLANRPLQTLLLFCSAHTKTTYVNRFF